MHKLFPFLFVLILLSCDALKMHDETFYIYPDDQEYLEVLELPDIARLIADTSVGRYVDIEENHLFIPVNFDYNVSTVGKYSVPIADLTITEDVNNYKPIRFSSEESSFMLNSGRNTFLFFIPSDDPLAISKAKLSTQFSNATYIDDNSLINGSTVIYYEYDANRNGFELFHSVKVPTFNDEITALEILYETIDILRMAKNLRKSGLKEFDWKKLEHVIPRYFPRYFSNDILDTIALKTKNQPGNFCYRYEAENLEIEFATIKDSSLAIFIEDLNKTPLKEDYHVDDNYSLESKRILEDYLKYYSFEIELYEKDGNTFYMNDGFDRIVLHFIPEKKLLFSIKDDDAFNLYNDEIYYRYFEKVFIPKLEK